MLFKSAYIQDIKAITNKAHKVGAIVILDTYHSVGIIPVDVQSLGVDILVGGVLKWFMRRAGRRVLVGAAVASEKINAKDYRLVRAPTSVRVRSINEIC